MSKPQLSDTDYGFNGLVRIFNEKEIENTYDYKKEPLYIGCGNPNHVDEMYFKGLISDVAIWKKPFNEKTI